MKKEVVEKLAMLVSSAFGLVAALAWNNTIKALFKVLFGSPDNLGAMMIYALIVTVVAVFATIWIGKIAEKSK